MSIIPALLRRRRGSAGGSSAYLLAGRRPTLVADFKNNYYAARSLDVGDYVLSGLDPSLVVNFRDNTYLTNGRELMTAHTRHGLITSGRSTTMIVRDSDGIYKHGAHNLYRNGAGGAQAITVVSGRDYTIRMKGTGSIGYSGAATGTLSGTGADDVVRVEVTATTTTLTVTPSGSTSEIAVYQSDLGGMQLTSDGTDYVENNTGAALYAAPVEYDVNGVRSMPVWGARTNSIPNSVFAGATNGIIGSGGAYPTGMGAANTLGLSPVIEIVGTGSEYGLPYLDLRFAGTATSGGQQMQLFPMGTTTIAASSGQTWTGSFYWRVVAGSISASFEAQIRIQERNSLGTFLAQTGTIVATPGSSISRVFETRTLTEATTAYTTTYPTLVALSAASIDVTLRIYAPQMEQGLGASPYIPTYGSTATRAADNLYTLVSSFGYRQTEGTIVAEFESAGYATVRSHICELHDGSANNRVVLRTNISTAVALRSVVGGALKTNVDAGAAQTSQDADTVATAVKAGDNAVAFKGGASATGSTADSQPSGITRLQYGSQGSPVQLHLNGKIYSLAYYPFRAANSDLEAASA